MKYVVMVARVWVLMIALSVSLTGGVNAAGPPAPILAPAAPGVSSSAPKGVLLPPDGYVLLRLSDAAQFGAPNKKDDTTQERLNSMAALATAVLAPLAWPLAAALIVWLLLRTPAIQILLNKIPIHVTQLNVAGLEIKLTPGAETTLADLQKLIQQVPGTHKDWVANSLLQPQFQQLIARTKNYLLESTQYDCGTPMSAEQFGTFRFTLHVPDVLLEHSFRQLLDYTGRRRGGAGRVYSMRIGIIGKAWRLERSEYVADHAYNEDQLVEMWGMTRPEARDTSGNCKEYIAILIRSDQGLPLAVLYADSPGSTLFDPARYGSAVSSDRDVFERLEMQIEKASKECGLTESLRVLDEQRRRVPQLDIYRTRDY